MTAGPSTQLVTVDIGGTHARFAIAALRADGSIALGEPETLHTRDHASFQAAWEDFRSRRGGTLPAAASLALAGPIAGDTIQLTNNPWVIHPKLVRATLGIERVTIVNDFEAVAHAVATVGDEHFVHLAGPDRPLARSGTLSVLGPGTGLGVAHLWRDGRGAYHVQATEGGHIDFAPTDSTEDAILSRLRKRHSRVSLERVVSGPAIVDIYQTLAAMGGGNVPEIDDVEIWTRGTGGSGGVGDNLAAAAVDRFCLALGGAAGDVALIQGGFGGVVIAGGLGYRLHDTLARSGFAERFCRKGRYRQLMANIPVKLITHPQPGLFGAAAAFAREHLEPIA